MFSWYKINMNQYVFQLVGSDGNVKLSVRVRPYARKGFDLGKHIWDIILQNGTPMHTMPVRRT